MYFIYLNDKIFFAFSLIWLVLPRKQEGIMTLPIKILLIVTIVLAIILIALIIIGKKAEKKAESQRSAMEAQSQTMSLFIIDKRKMKLKDAGFPKIVMEQTPKYLRRAKVPIIKVKVGPKVMSLMCDSKVYDNVLPKQEVKAQVSGIYVTSAKRVRGPLPEPKKTKKEIRSEKKAAKAKEKANARSAKK